ncbi:hypothetical protein NQ317_005734 [Molorchus minor]|uniref:Uncharacterized protein n=1 Tax=Molorchus minor TaxID=1323400 RepID=A0ABQ9JI64_9CUCU|nr:hypothetical protein NQ317_005734 [Molorchus minor]
MWSGSEHLPFIRLPESQEPQDDSDDDPPTEKSGSVHFPKPSIFQSGMPTSLAKDSLVHYRFINGVQNTATKVPFSNPCNSWGFNEDMR